jgi:murein DD-endopeptidase MepM/ murein hydrolase activator NlpD
MKIFLLLLLLLAGGFAFWKYNESKGSDKIVNDGSITHVVVKGETLYSISRKYGTTVASIKDRNDFSNDTIHVGDSLRIHAGERKKSPSASASTARKETPKKDLPKPKSSKVIAKKELPKSTVMESSNIGIDIDDKNQVYLKTKAGKFAPAGTIIYGSDADANGMEIKTITYRDLKGKETTLPGSADPESVIRLALKKR